MSDLFINVDIRDSEEPDWVLSALFMDGKYTMPSLTTPDPQDTWDNPEYLFNKLHPLLERYVSRKLTDDDVEDLYKDKLDQYLNDDNNLAGVLLEMLNKAKSMGWHKIKL